MTTYYNIPESERYLIPSIFQFIYVLARLEKDVSVYEKILTAIHDISDKMSFQGYFSKERLGISEQKLTNQETASLIINSYQAAMKTLNVAPNPEVFNNIQDIRTWSHPLWNIIHCFSLILPVEKFRVMMNVWKETLPCQKCRDHLAEYLGREEIDNPFLWGLRLHKSISQAKLLNRLSGSDKIGKNVDLSEEEIGKWRTYYSRLLNR